MRWYRVGIVILTVLACSVLIVLGVLRVHASTYWKFLQLRKGMSDVEVRQTFDGLAPMAH